MAALASALLLLCVAPAGAQSLDSFKLFMLGNEMRFRVNDTDVLAQPSVDVSGLLNGTGNKVEVGWGPPGKGTAIVLQYTGPAGSAFGGAIAAGDVLKVYAIGGVFLTDADGIASAGAAGSTMTRWDNTTGVLPTGWAYDGGQGGNYFGYKKSSPFSSPLSSILGFMDSGTQSGKSFTGAREYATLRFGGVSLSPGTSGTFLGLDVFADVLDANGNTKRTAQTGRARITAYDDGNDPPQEVPESSTLALLGFGGLPLLVAAARARKRR